MNSPRGFFPFAVALALAAAATFAAEESAAAKQLPNVPPLLREALHKLYVENARLAYTRTTGRTVERFDPSAPDSLPWRLVRVEGRSPTPTEIDAWEKRLAAELDRPALNLADFLDLDRARVLERAADRVDFAVPVRSLRTARVRVADVYALLSVAVATGELRRFELMSRVGWVGEPLDVTMLLLDGHAMPPPALVRLVGATSVQSGATTWGDYERVTVPHPRAEVRIGELRVLEN